MRNTEKIIADVLEEIYTPLVGKKEYAHRILTWLLTGDRRLDPSYTDVHTVIDMLPDNSKYRPLLEDWIKSIPPRIRRSTHGKNSLPS